VQDTFYRWEVQEKGEHAKVALESTFYVSDEMHGENNLIFQNITAFILNKTVLQPFLKLDIEILFIFCQNQHSPRKLQSSNLL
jgi:hypothetical protein